MAITQYVYNSVVRLTATFTDINDVAADPTTVTVKTCNPSEVITTKVYITDPEVIKDSTGVYHIDVAVNEEGIWHFRWEGTGSIQIANEDLFEVKQSTFV